MSQKLLLDCHVFSGVVFVLPGRLITYEPTDYLYSLVEFHFNLAHLLYLGYTSRSVDCAVFKTCVIVFIDCYYRETHLGFKCGL